MTPIIEPPTHSQEDTRPIKPVTISMTAGSVGQKSVSWFGVASIVSAVLLTLATAGLLLAPTPQPVATFSVVPTAQVLIATREPMANGLPTAAPLAIAAVDVPVNLDTSQWLGAPLENFAASTSLQIVRDVYNPFTTVSDRPRDEVVHYTVVNGDTIDSIATRFGLKSETIAWSNPNRYIEVLRPGDVMNIPPVDGVYFQAIGSKTIADYATEYLIDDPYIIIDSDYNQLHDATPQTVPPSGEWIFIPNGTGKRVVWTVQVGINDPGSGSSSGYVNSFAPGDPGSCGKVNNPGGGAQWVLPLHNYTIVRGFSSFHSGIDLSAPMGAPVFAANSGAVIFAGWNSFGYGYAIVLAHGPFLTLYGHLSNINVSCGQQVGAGQMIGGVGSTGNSSGPHLHFEIRYGYTATDPSATLSF